MTSEQQRCGKPGCGAIERIGNPCTDWDCPQKYVVAAVYRRLQEALAAAETRIAAKDEALKPFARHASQFDGLDDEWFCTPAVQIKHLRAAIRSLSADEAQP